MVILEIIQALGWFCKRAYSWSQNFVPMLHYMNPLQASIVDVVPAQNMETSSMFVK